MRPSNTIKSDFKQALLERDGRFEGVVNNAISKFAESEKEDVRGFADSLSAVRMAVIDFLVYPLNPENVKGNWDDSLDRAEWRYLEIMTAVLGEK